MDIPLRARTHAGQLQYLSGILCDACDDLQGKAWSRVAGVAVALQMMAEEWEQREREVQADLGVGTQSWPGADVAVDLPVRPPERRAP